MTPVASTAVVHLVRHANGIEPFEAFMSSLEQHEPGSDHDLVLLFKGFPDRATTLPYLERAVEHRPRRVDVPDTGLDLTAYVAAGEALRSHERLCFLNSFSEVQGDGWLAHLERALSRDRVGMAGATGSWGSPLSYGLFQIGLPTPYRSVFPDRATPRDALHELAGATSRGDLPNWIHNLVLTTLRAPRKVRFPNVHLRTNAFLIEGALLRSLRAGRLRSKRATYDLESGRASLTRQIRARGLDPVVVDRHGTARRPSEWPSGAVFWQEDQHDLLVADNQTRSYAAATATQRRVLSAYAWGERARPL